MRTRSVVAFVLAASLVTVPARGAAAHASLVVACPAPGEVMSVLETIELGFSSPLDATEAQPPEIELAASDGLDQIDVGPAVLVGPRTIVASVPASIPPGVYTVSYRVLSFDGDLNEGAHEFTYDPTAGQPGNCLGVSEVSADDGQSGIDIWLFVGTGALIALTGWVWQQSRRDNRPGKDR